MLGWYANVGRGLIFHLLFFLGGRVGVNRRQDIIPGLI